MALKNSVLSTLTECYLRHHNDVIAVRVDVDDVTGIGAWQTMYAMLNQILKLIS